MRDVQTNLILLGCLRAESPANFKSRRQALGRKLPEAFVHAPHLHTHIFREMQVMVLFRSKSGGRVSNPARCQASPHALPD